MPRPKMKFEESTVGLMSHRLYNNLQIGAMFPGKTKGERDARTFLEGSEPFQKISETFRNLPTKPGEETNMRDRLAERFSQMQNCFESLSEFSNSTRDINVYNEEKWNEVMDQIDQFNDIQAELYSFNQLTGYRYSTEPFMNAAFGAVRGANTVSTQAYEYAHAQYMREVHAAQLNMDNRMQSVKTELNIVLNEGFDNGDNIVRLEKDYGVLENIQKVVRKEVQDTDNSLTVLDKSIDQAENNLIYEDKFKVKELEYQIAVQQRKMKASERSTLEDQKKGINRDIQNLGEFFANQGFNDFVDLFDQLENLQNNNQDHDMDEEIEDVEDQIVEKEKTPPVNNRNLSEYRGLRKQSQDLALKIDRVSRNVNSAIETETYLLKNLKEYAQENGLEKNFEQIQENAAQNCKTVEELKKNKEEAQYQAGRAEKVHTPTSELFGKVKSINQGYLSKRKDLDGNISKKIGDYSTAVGRFRRAKESYSNLYNQRDMVEHHINSLTEFSIEGRIQNSLQGFITKLDQNRRFLHFDSSEYKAMSNAIKNYQNQPSKENMEAIHTAAENYIAAKLRGRENDSKTTSMRDYRLNVAADLRDFAKSHETLAERENSRRNELEGFCGKMETYKDLKLSAQQITETKLANAPDKSSLTDFVAETKQLYNIGNEKKTEACSKLKNELQKNNAGIDTQALQKVEKELDSAQNNHPQVGAIH